MNYAHLVYGMQMASTTRENFLSVINGFLNQEKVDIRNCGVQAMLCPCIDCLNQKKFAQQEIIFHHFVTRGFKKNTRVGINMVRKALMNSKQVA
jgi:hypothetical protein